MDQMQSNQSLIVRQSGMVFSSSVSCWHFGWTLWAHTWTVTFCVGKRTSLFHYRSRLFTNILLD